MAEASVKEEVVPVLPEDVNAGRIGTAPPSYEEVMGQYKTSIISDSQSELPSLAYIDIMPRLLYPGDIKNKIPPTFQPFTDIMKGANIWLRDNPAMSVWKCETVERKVEGGSGHGGVTVDLENMCHHESTYGFNSYVFGLRLWLTPRPPSQINTVQEIGLYNILPKRKEIDVTMINSYGRRFGRGFGIGQFMATSHVKKFVTYEGLKKSIEEFNANVTSNPVPGTVLNIESTTLKFGEGFQLDDTANVAEASSWHDRGQTTKRYTQILRLFYVKGSPTTPQINMIEFLPTQLTQPEWNRPLKFAQFNDATLRASAWIQNQSAIKIVNIETRDARVHKGFGEVTIDTDSTDDIEFGVFDSNKLRFLRIFYIPDKGAPPFAHASMTSRLFVPMKLGASNFETMTQTMNRIDAWMKLAGQPIFGVETVTYLKTGSALGIDDVRSDYSIKTFSSKHWVTAIRVYFPNPFDEPDPSLLPKPPKGSNKSSACVII